MPDAELSTVGGKCLYLLASYRVVYMVLLVGRGVMVGHGDDMVRTHPDIFIHSDFAILNKVDIADAVGVDPNILLNDYKKLTGGRKTMIETSARQGTGLDAVIEELGL